MPNFQWKEFKACLQIEQCELISSVVMADILRLHPWYGSVAAENTKGFLGVTDKKDGYSFVYPFGWQVCIATFLMLY